MSDIGKLCWHVHHDILVEPLTEELQTRIDHIKQNKPHYEIATRLRLIHLVKGKFPKTEACAKWQEVDAKRQEAYAKWQEAYAKWQEADAKWQEADAKWQEAYAKLQEAYAKRQEADAKWQEAYAKWQEAYAKWQEADAKSINELHAKECPNCPWNGETFFP
jgi:hypothetical protein